MRERFSSRRKLIGLIGVGAVVVALIASAIYVRVSAAPQAQFTALPNSVSALPASVARVGAHSSSSQLVIDLVLKPQGNPVADLTTIETPDSPIYHQYLPKNQFNQRYAPSAATLESARSFLQSDGLKILNSKSPLLLRATGTTAQIESTFHTTIEDFRTAKGETFFQNVTPVQVPSNLAKAVYGVAGLTDTYRLHPNYVLSHAAAQRENKRVYTYGGGPGGSGLTPSQLSSMYSATAIHKVGAKGQGAGVTAAVYELSGYTRSDIMSYEHRFFGASENVSMNDIPVDGGPINPVLPPGDVSAFGAPDYSGDVEVNADIETLLAIAPKLSTIDVYNAPNDILGVGPLDEYYQIAADNSASVISTSWGLCELDATFPIAIAEYDAFLQMSMQGQTILAASGDDGAYDCVRDFGSPNQNSISVDDPASQPYVTGVGGTSFGLYNPVSNATPAYPGETPWNPLGQCTSAADCDGFGAGGGGNSAFWGFNYPNTGVDLQHGPGVISSQSHYYPYCQQAVTSQLCREVPDVSANADEFTPYAEYCTGNPSTNSSCAQFAALGFDNLPGWFGIGGTSLATPLWASVFSLWVSYHSGARFGRAVGPLYWLLNHAKTYSIYFHDIYVTNNIVHNNGFYEVTPNYDMDTGIGSPNISNMAYSNPLPPK